MEVVWRRGADMTAVDGLSRISAISVVGAPGLPGVAAFLAAQAADPHCMRVRQALLDQDQDTERVHLVDPAGVLCRVGSLYGFPRVLAIASPHWPQTSSRTTTRPAAITSQQRFTH